MTQRDRTVVLVVAALVAIAAFWFLALKPKREEIQTANTRIGTAQSTLDTANAALTSARESKAKYRSYYGTVANLGKAVPTDDNVPSLVYQLDRIAKKHNVVFQSIELKPGSGAAAPTTPSDASATVTATLPPGAAVGAAGFPTMPFTFVFRGSFFTLQKFLADINYLTTVRRNGKNEEIRVRGRLLQIDGIGLTAGPEGFPSVEAKVAATAYVLPEDQGLTAGATPGSPSGTATPAQSKIDTDGSAR
jgi:hypothetical protein